MPLVGKEEVTNHDISMYFTFPSRWRRNNWLCFWLFICFGLCALSLIFLNMHDGRSSVFQLREKEREFKVHRSKTQTAKQKREIDPGKKPWRQPLCPFPQKKKLKGYVTKRSVVLDNIYNTQPSYIVLTVICLCPNHMLIGKLFCHIIKHCELYFCQRSLETIQGQNSWIQNLHTDNFNFLHIYMCTRLWNLECLP